MLIHINKEMKRNPFVYKDYHSIIPPAQKKKKNEVFVLKSESHS